MISRHKRNTDPMHDSSRCGAKTRSGFPCRSPAVSGKARCRMHGGAKGAGAPTGNSNALKHGAYTAEKIADRTEFKRRLDALLEKNKSLVEDLKNTDASNFWK
ncbi:HGGxSTG domain-containing protein [Falsihalocynthiibacter sp. BN13B15]|uniref:HGGxSTG domain-containing protein n=1 Tax=Falsihalocynthiibacter sp. BN13B15 TaxID=3240871 RepID=UPI00350FD76A